MPGAVALPPALTTPGALTVEATSAKGAAVAYTVTADDPNAQIVCNPPSGYVFPLGATRVECTATNPSTGEVSRAFFTVTVADTKPPVLASVPRPIVLKVNAVSKATVSYTRPVARDSVDGVVPVTCFPPSGSGFDLGETEVMCAAVDGHGNAGSASFLVRVSDSLAPPPATDVIVRGGKGLVTLTWRLPNNKDVAGTEIVRLPENAVVFRGPGTSFTDHEFGANLRYTYVVTTYDRANNRSRGVTVAAAPRATNLIVPQDGAVLTAPPLLAWQPVAGADYYNVQLWALSRSGPVKILSIWPTANHLQLARSWVYLGKHQLTGGRYRWYVWPGVGPLVLARYGALIGASAFTITAPPK